MNVSEYSYSSHRRISHIIFVVYSIGAEIMMYCVKKCLGPKICTPAVMFVFAKFFSRVLEIMLPLSIQQEMAGNITNRRPEGPLVKH